MYDKLKPVLEEAERLPTQRLTVAAAQDRDVLESVKMACERDLISPTLVGNAKDIEKIAREIGFDLSGVEVVDRPDSVGACQEAVSRVRDGRADLVMKGIVQTADFLRAVLNRDYGLRTGRMLSHVSIIDVPGFDRPLFVSDAGINISPTLAEKAQIIDNACEVARMVLDRQVRVALLAAIETVNPEMPATMDAAALSKMAERGQLGRGALVEGPLALDNAIDLAAARHKGLRGEVAGRADVIIVPDIEVGNALVKSVTFLAGGVHAGTVAGAAAPIVLTSRADSPETKLASIAFSAVLSVRRRD